MATSYNKTPSQSLSKKQFQQQLAFGQQAETDIACWFIKRGHLVLPIYDIEYDTGKGPRIFSIDGELVAPDLIVFLHSKELIWVEAKHKSVFTWYRKTGAWTTGIDLNHYQSYLAIRKQLNYQIFILFLHQSSEPDYRDLNFGCPNQCPTGLYGDEILSLKERESHRSTNYGRHGMVYWEVSSLKQFASLKEVQNAVKMPRDLNLDSPKKAV